MTSVRLRDRAVSTPTGLTAESGDPPALSTVVAAAAIRGGVAAFAGLILVAGITVVLWAASPASSDSVVDLLRGGLAAVGAAHFLPIAIGDTALTLTPLLLTAVAVVLIAATCSRGRVVPAGRFQELVAAGVTGVAYGIAVTAVVAAFGPGAVVTTQGWWWAPISVGLVSSTVGTAVRGTAWRGWWNSRLPGWWTAGVRAGAAGAAALAAGGALAVAGALTLSFGTATALSDMASQSFGDALGMTLACLLFLPNAVVAGVGYVTGTGFTLGEGSYSPFGTVGTELPALPLLAAAPDSGGLSLPGLALLLIPVLAAFVAGRSLVRRVPTRRDRLAGALVAAVVAAGVWAGLAALAAGGVAGGPWSWMGVPVLAMAAAVGAAFGGVTIVVAASARVVKVATATSASLAEADVQDRDDAPADQTADGAADCAADDAAGAADEAVDEAADEDVDDMPEDADESASAEDRAAEARTADARGDGAARVEDTAALVAAEEAATRDLDDREAADREVNGSVAPNPKRSGSGRSGSSAA